MGVSTHAAVQGSTSSNYDLFVSGFKIALWSFFMKLVVGDRVGIYVGTFFDSYAAYSSMSCILVTLLYSIQIY